MSSFSLQLHDAMHFLLNSIWDPIAQHASAFPVEEISYDGYDGTSDFPWRLPKTPRKPVSSLFTPRTKGLKVSRRRRAGKRTPAELAVEVAGLIHTEKCAPDCSEDHLDLKTEPRRHIIYKVLPRSASENQPDFGASHEIPSHIPEEIRRGILMMNLCECSIKCMKDIVEYVMKQFDPDAKVSWMAVIPRPRYEFISPNRSSPAIFHTVIHIVTKNGAKFVLDPTAEQYGIHRSERFLPFRVYKKRYIIRSKFWNGCGRYSCLTEEFEDDANKMVGYWKEAAQNAEGAFAEWEKGLGGNNWWLNTSSMDPAQLRSEEKRLADLVRSFLR